MTPLPYLEVGLAAVQKFGEVVWPALFSRGCKEAAAAPALTAPQFQRPSLGHLAIQCCLDDSQVARNALSWGNGKELQSKLGDVC